MEESRYITGIIKTFIKFIWLIALFAIIGGIAGKMTASTAPAPTYQAYNLVLIEGPKYDFDETIVFKQTDDYGRLFNTAQTIVHTPIVLDQVKKELNLKETNRELRNKIMPANENGSNIMRITVEDRDPKKATAIVNKVSEVFKEKIGSYIDLEDIKILEKAIPKQELKIEHARPNANTLMGVIIGAVIGTLLAFLLDFVLKRRKASI